MLKNSLIGAAVFGLASAAAGYVWVAFEFPFAIVFPAAIGWYAVTIADFGHRKALWAALLGGIAFTGAFMSAIFLALTDGSPFALTAWMSAVLAAAVAGAVTGWLLDRSHGSLSMALFSAAGMLAATVAMGLMRSFAPAATDVAGPIQSAYFALAQGLVGVFVGAALGAGTSWLAGHLGWNKPMAHAGRPHGA